MGVTLKILELRKTIKDMNLKATGYNGHAKYNYFQLSDFLPQTIDVCLKLGLYDEYTEDEEYFTLVMIDVETGEERIFKKKRIEIPEVVPQQPSDKAGTVSQRVGTTSQAVGSVDTYYMRYLYRNMLKLTEPDFTEIMAERNSLIQAITQTAPQNWIKGKVNEKGKFRIEDLTNEELRELWQSILELQKEAKNKEKINDGE